MNGSSGVLPFSLAIDNPLAYSSIDSDLCWERIERQLRKKASRLGEG